MSRQLSYRGLQAFRLTMLTGSVSAAAATLNLSQPAVSRLLKELELDTGLSLFDRTSGRLVPTLQAGQLLEEVERSFVGLDRIAAATRDIARGRRGTLSVSVLPILAHSLFPRVLVDFARQMPGISVRFDSAGSQTVTQQIMTGQYDIGFVSLSVPLADLEITRRYRLACRCILPAGHRLHGKAVITPQDLQGETLVSASRRTLMDTQVQAMLNRNGIEVSMTIETPLLPLASLLVLEGAGLAIVDAITAAHHERLGGVAANFEPSVELELAVVRRRDAPQSGAEKALMEIFDLRMTPYLRSSM
ncbi:MAG TPA: LysR substrate-binding domain-containing protein [Bosea sp. (in: a-proteobacteria)]|jgi:DNA-binding transcriptional LysR family regulator|uniref:LysR substrate-binding domain-containing protein n=1 Tax=Bosea sp. (in: a-proteobacteria) TaxID=1871050 RepID=UPI002E155B30|nr:LysR substrate-binding domain-containing protein [Bosea sp. (in: a-proteobacteria)]